MQEGLDATINQRVGGNELHVNTQEERKAVAGELIDVRNKQPNQSSSMLVLLCLTYDLQINQTD